MTLRGTLEEHAALQAARRRERTPGFAELYALRTGVEATISQAVRTLALQRSCHSGFAKTHLQHVVTAATVAPLARDPCPKRRLTPPAVSSLRTNPEAPRNHNVREAMSVPKANMYVRMKFA